MIKLEDVMAEANARYAAVCIEQHRSYAGRAGIPSEQVKALAAALVNQINQALKELP